MNWLAIIVAAIVQVVIGFIWYGPLFGKTWMAMMGLTQQSISRAGMTKTYAWTVVGSLVTAYVLAKFVGWLGAMDFGAGLKVGVWAWLGFVATVTLASVLYEKRSVNLYVLNNGFQLISLALMGGLLAAWH